MNPLQTGITAARAGQQAEARTHLQQALQADPRSEQGWLWMSAVVETDAERRMCLERVLAINPHNQTARTGLEKLKTGNNPGQGIESYLPISRPVPLQDQAQGQTNGKRLPTPLPANPVAGPPSPHTMPTLGMSPVAPGARRIQRLESQPTPVDVLTQLRATQFKPQSPAPTVPPSQPDSWMALVLIGGLSVTAIAGALMLGILWLIG